MKEPLERGRDDVRPLFLKLGVALVISVAGFLFSQLRPRPRPRLPPPPPSTPGAESETSGASAIATVPGPGKGIKDELHILTSEEAFLNILHGASIAASTAYAAPAARPSPSTENSGDEEEFLLPEFNELLRREMEPSQSTLEIHEMELEQEIAYLRNLVRSLQERERSLEIQLLEYHKLKEKLPAMRELENRLKIGAEEAKLLSLKIESLEGENKRLRSQLSEHSRRRAELEAARATIEILERKLKSDEEQVRDNVAALLEKVAMLQDTEQKDAAEVQSKLKRLKELEDEAAHLSKANSRLKQENQDLLQKLDSAKLAAASTPNGTEVEMLEELNRLREANDRKEMEIEQLQTGRYADVEELVYLRWINACLRYELRNYQPSPGRTIARDLGKRLSPRSEEKAKQLILEYANLGIDEKDAGLMDFDPEWCSSSQSSAEETEDTSIDVSSWTKKSSSHKSKFFSKLRGLVLGRGKHSSKSSSVDKSPTSCGNSEKRASISTSSHDDVTGRKSYDSLSSVFSADHASASHLAAMDLHSREQWHLTVSQPKNVSRFSFNSPRPRRLHLEVGEGRGAGCMNDVGMHFNYEKMVSKDDSMIGLHHNYTSSLYCHRYTGSLDHEMLGNPDMARLKTFAKVLKSSHVSPKSKKW